MPFGLCIQEVKRCGPKGTPLQFAFHTISLPLHIHNTHFTLGCEQWGSPTKSNCFTQLNSCGVHRSESCLRQTPHLSLPHPILPKATSSLYSTPVTPHPPHVSLFHSLGGRHFIHHIAHSLWVLHQISPLTFHLLQIDLRFSETYREWSPPPDVLLPLGMTFHSLGGGRGPKGTGLDGVVKR